MTDRQLALQAWESLFRAQHELFGIMVSDFDGADVTQAEYDVLLTTVRSPQMSARLRDITANMLISQPSVSRLIDRMVARGLVTKAPDAADARSSIVTATDAGARAFRAVAPVPGRSIARCLSPLAAAELRTVLRRTQKLRGH